MKLAVIRNIVIVMILFFSFPPLYAQDPPEIFKRNAIYFELFGQGGLYSINYDYRIKEEISIRAGFTSWGIGVFENNFHFTGFPIMLNYLSGKRSGHLEAGVGFIPATVSFHGGDSNPFFILEGEGSSTRVLGTATLGYRFQPLQGGFVFRAGLTPFFADGVRLFGGASVGYAF